MANIVADRVWETSTTTGAGDMVLAGAVTASRPFSTVCSNGDTVSYVIAAVDASGADTGAWETGYGRYNSSANSITRLTVSASSNANAAVTFAAGTKRIGLSVIAKDIGPALGQIIEVNDPSGLPGTYLKCDGKAYPRTSYPLLAAQYPLAGVQPTHSNPPSTATAALNVAFGNGIWVGIYQSASTETFTSTNGVTWTARPGSLTNPGAATWGGIYFLNGIFIVVGKNAINTSTDGLTWTNRTAPSTTITYDRAVYNATTSTFLVYAASNTSAARSTDGGATWTLNTLSASPTTMVSGAGLFVMVGGGAIYSSPDAVTWTQRTTVTSSSPLLAYSPTAGFVMCGTTGFVGLTYLTSPDGITWTDRAALVSLACAADVSVGGLNPWGWGGSTAGMLTYHPVMGFMLFQTSQTSTANGVTTPSGMSMFVSTDGLNWKYATSYPYNAGGFRFSQFLNPLANQMMFTTSSPNFTAPVPLHLLDFNAATFNVPIVTLARTGVAVYIRAA